MGTVHDGLISLSRGQGAKNENQGEEMGLGLGLDESQSSSMAGMGAVRSDGKSGLLMVKELPRRLDSLRFSRSWSRRLNVMPGLGAKGKG